MSSHEYVYLAGSLVIACMLTIFCCWCWARSEKRRQAMLEDKRKAMLDQFEQEKAAMAKVRPFCSFVSRRCPDTCF